MPYGNKNFKVLRARLMDRDKDFRKLGINPDKVEKREDGRRTKVEEPGSEIWYFDGMVIFAFLVK